MSNVNLTIGGRFYKVACAEGEEAHIESLGRTIDGKLHDLPNMAGQSEARTLLFAALLLADEVHELRAGVGGSGSAPAKPDPRAAEALESLAERLESLAGHLEGAA
jgi:cell division protein ZapA